MSKGVYDRGWIDSMAYHLNKKKIKKKNKKNYKRKKKKSDSMGLEGIRETHM